MKRRLPYLLAFVVVLLLEIIIALFVRDRFVRPYIGDYRFAVLFCSDCQPEETQMAGGMGAAVQLCR